MNYTQDLACTIAACLHQAADPSILFKLPVTCQDAKAAQEVYQSLQSSEAKWHDLHPLMRVLWSVPDPVLGEGTKSIYFLCFLTAAALRQDRTLMDTKRLVT